MNFMYFFNSQKFLFVMLAIMASFGLNAMEFNRSELPSEEQKVHSCNIEEQEPFEWPSHLSYRWRRLPEGAMQQVFTNLFKSLESNKEKHLFALHSIKESIKNQHPFNPTATGYIANQLKNILDKNPRIILDKGMDGLINSVIPRNVRVPNRYFYDKNKAVVSKFADNNKKSINDLLKDKKVKMVNQNNDLQSALHESFTAQMKKQPYPNAPYYEWSTPKSTGCEARYSLLFYAPVDPIWIGILNDVCTTAFTDDHTLVVGTKTGTIHILDFENNNNKKLTTANKSALTAILNNTATLFASAYNDGTITLFDLKTNKQTDLKAQKGCMILAFSDENNYLIGASNTILTIWDLNSKKLVCEYDLKNDPAAMYLDEPASFKSVKEIYFNESTKKLLVSIIKQLANGEDVTTVLKYYLDADGIRFEKEKERKHVPGHVIDVFNVPSLSKVMLNNDKYTIIGNGIMCLTWQRRALDLCDFDASNKTHEKRFRIKFQASSPSSRFIKDYIINPAATKLVALSDDGKLFMWEIPQILIRDNADLHNELCFYALWKYFNATADAKKSIKYNDEQLFPSYAFSKNDQVKLQNLLNLDTLPENEKELMKKLVKMLRISSKNEIMLSNIIHALKYAELRPVLRRVVFTVAGLELLAITYFTFKKGPSFIFENSRELLRGMFDDLSTMKNYAIGLMLGLVTILYK